VKGMFRKKNWQKGKIAIYTDAKGQTQYFVIGTETETEVVNRLHREGSRWIVIFEAKIFNW